MEYIKVDLMYYWVALFHDTRFNDAQFIHKLCLFLHAINRVIVETQPTSHQKGKRFLG